MAVPVVFSTGSLYPFGLDRVFGWAAEAGYDGVEVMMDERWDTHQEAYLKSLTGEYGIPIRALHPPLYRGAWGLDPDETLVRSAKLAARLGAGVIVAHPPNHGSLERWKAETLAEARSHGAAVAVENMPRKRERRLFFHVEARRCWSPEELVGLGDVTLDTSHLGASRVDPMQAWEVLNEQVRHVHLSDSNFEPGRDEHRIPGTGRLPLKPLLGALAGSDYPGVISLELKPWPLGAPDPAKILDKMRRALEFTREGLNGKA